MRSSEDDSEDGRRLLQDGRSMGPKMYRTWRTQIVMSLCFLAGLVLGLLANTYRHTTSNPWDAQASVRFERNETFEYVTPGPEADALWEQLMPLGRGFVQVEADGTFIPHRNSEEHSSQTKVVSVFHQVHCLNMLRKSLYASAGNAVDFKYMIPQLEHHWRHCFDYLRQSIMCLADTTLEEVRKGADRELVVSVDGWGTEHMCKDWSAIYESVERHRGTDDGGID